MKAISLEKVVNDVEIGCFASENYVWVRESGPGLRYRPAYKRVCKNGKWKSRDPRDVSPVCKIA